MSLLMYSCTEHDDRKDTCIVLCVDDAFCEYARVLLFSLRKHNPDLDVPLIVLHSKTLSPLSREHQASIQALWANASFTLVDETPYERFFPFTPPRLHAALLKLETFNLTICDRAVFLDADMLCLGDITPLFALNTPFAACPAGKDRILKEKVANTRRRIGFNSGVMVIGRRHLDGRTYRNLLASPLRPCPTADQDILNRFFRWKRIHCLDHRYNYHAHFFWNGNETDVKMLHYAGQKPLEAPDEERMQIWFHYHRELVKWTAVQWTAECIRRPLSLPVRQAGTDAPSTFGV